MSPRKELIAACAAEPTPRAEPTPASAVAIDAPKSAKNIPFILICPPEF